MTMIARELAVPVRIIVREGYTPRMESLFRGNVTEVKVVLTSVALALAGYQLVLAAVGYRKLRPPFLEPRPAFRAHRASGDTIAALLVLVAVLCVAYFGIEDDAAFHAVTGAILIAVLALKVFVIRRWHAASRFLPALGISVFVLLAVTWAASAGAFLS
jgi:hypothetical protein